VAYRSGLFVTFTVGSPGATEGLDPTTEERDPWPSDGFVGSLAVVPGSNDDATLAVRLVMGLDRDARSCAAPDYRGCVVARRRLRYSPHERLRLPMTLYAECKDIPCDPASTCNILGQCVPADVDPASCASDEGCAVHGDPQAPSPPPRSDASADGPRSDGATTEAGADATDAADGAGDSGKDGATPGSIDCRTRSCAAGAESCCYDETTQTGQCTPSSLICGDPMNVTLQCDGPEDCMPGSFCCGMGSFAVCVANGSCSGYQRLCHTAADCTGGGKLCLAFGFHGYFSSCQ
jgi:hypothetical protein